MSTTNLELYQGRDASYVLDISRDDIEFDEGDLAGLVVCIKRDHGQTDAEATIRKLIGSGLTVLEESDAEIVRVRLDFTAAETAELSALVSYYWDAAVKTADGKLHPIDALAGRVTLTRRVAHSADA
jgi:hypothetical protein